ncbi:hypothetical protein JCM17823_03100 [Halorubrum gandharaense]
MEVTSDNADEERHEHIPLPDPSKDRVESRRQREGTNHVGGMGGRTGSSDLVFFSGFLPVENGTVLNERSTEWQAERCFDRLETRLADRRCDLDDVLKLEVQVTSAADADAVERAYRNRFDGERPPRTTVGVCSLPGGAHVQLDVVAGQE